MMDADNKNDRSILILLQCKAEKTRCDEKEIGVLERLYPDNDKYKDDLVGELINRGYLRKRDLTPELPTQNDRGFPNVRLWSEPITTENGITALKRGEFKSEYKANKREKLKRIQDTAVAVAAVAALLLSILNAFQNHQDNGERTQEQRDGVECSHGLKD